MGQQNQHGNQGDRQNAPGSNDQSQRSTQQQEQEGRRSGVQKEDNNSVREPQDPRNAKGSGGDDR
ncbi:MAG TPA: hypothetical protein VFS55_07155 [Dokdonella sp.]|nr:hypothetical protein [Dokdonella sp.]